MQEGDWRTHNVSTRNIGYAQCVDRLSTFRTAEVHLTIFTAPLFAAALLAQNMFGGLPIDGIGCDTTEGALEHVHTHVQLFNRGRAVTIPSNIGIPLDGSCLYWVHTHAADGIVHIESPVMRTFLLGQFFDIWQTPLTRTQAGSVRAAHGHTLRVTVNGKVWNKDPRLIPLRDREEIVIQNGPPYVSGHPADWSKL